MWCDTVDYEDISIILKKYDMIKSKDVGISEWFLRNHGSKNLTVRITSSHWCGIHTHYLEIYDTHGEYYHWIPRNNKEYDLLLDMPLPNKSIEDLENRLIEILKRFE